MAPKHREIWREKRGEALIVVKAITSEGILTTDLGGPTDGLENVWSHDEFSVARRTADASV